MTNLTPSTTSAAPTDDASRPEGRFDRRSFLARAAIAGAATLLPTAGLLTVATSASAEGRDRPLSVGDAAILRFLATAELLEADLWQQYAELANNNPDFMAALQVIDGDMPTYVSQNTEDEFSHANFINAYLLTHHRQPADLDAFRTLPSSTATGALQQGRLTNLMNLNVDTSWYTRYRSSENPDFGDAPPQIVNIVNRPAIPLQDGYTSNQIQAIANTAAFHFAAIEQGGSSLYDTMSLNVEDATVLRIVTGIGGTEVAHFEIWNDKAGDTPAVDSGDGLVFPDLTANTQFISNQVMPKPCKFIDDRLPLCSTIRPTSLNLAGAKAAVRALTASGLFQGQSPAFFRTLTSLAAEADRAARQF